MTTTVTQIERVTIIIVKRRYLPINGTTRLVEGIISTNSKKKTVREIRMEIDRVTFSPLSLGR